MESIVTLALGIICIVIGLSNCKGNISTLHSYHRNRVAEEDILPFGKLVGLGTIIIGISLIIASIITLTINSELIINIILTIGFVVGMGLNLYAIIKYNKGLF